jgi:hypothetical protein
VTDAQVVAKAKGYMPRLLLKAARMRLYVSILSSRYMPALVVLAAAYDAKRSWAKAVESDFQWLASVTDKLEQYRGLPLAGWTQLIQQHKGYLIQMINATTLQQSHLAVDDAAKTDHHFTAIDLTGDHDCTICNVTPSTAPGNTKRFMLWQQVTAG